MAPYGTSPNDLINSLHSVRERCIKVQTAATQNRLHHFDIDESKLDEMVNFVISIIKRDYNDPSEIPTYSRWRHFDIGDKPRLDNLLKSWETLHQNKLEQTRRLIDILVIAVLMDIKPCQTWAYTEKSTGRVFKRKDGIAVAILELFMDGVFSSDPTDPHRVDSEALIHLSLQTLREGLQFTEVNLFVGIEERLEVLNHLGLVLQNRTDYFGATIHRPGNLMDYLLAHKSTITTLKGPLIDIATLWPVALEMGELWASEDNIGGTPGLGDVWPCLAISNDDKNLVSFHKLSQWLVYSMIEPMEKLLGATIEGTDMLTPLPDYCNGGFLIDSGFLTLKQLDYERGIKNYHTNSLLQYQPKVEVAPMFDMSDPVVIEWRALTVAYLGDIAESVRKYFRSDRKVPLSRKEPTLSQLIQGGTWSAGRELAEISRPNTHEPPIVIKIDKRVIY